MPARDWHEPCSIQRMMRFSLALCVITLAANFAAGNDLKEFYELALTRDTTLQAAHFQRDALVEARPQAIAQWLPQISANASATRGRVSFATGPAVGRQAGDCAIRSTGTSRPCCG